MSVLPTAGLPLAKSTTASKDQIENAARELETQFAHMMIKSMRSASPGDPFGGDTTYRDMHDMQLAKELSKGRGLGLQSSIVRQLERSNGGHPDAPAHSTGPMPLRPPSVSLPLTQPSSGMPMSPGSLPLAPASRGASLSGAPITLAMPPFAPVTARTAATAYASVTPCAANDVDCTTPDNFVASIWPAAEQTARELGVSPHALVAQAALETNWGRTMIGHESNEVSNNLFGIKATNGWGGSTVTAGTHEFEGGELRSQRAEFRAYATAADSFRDYARLISSDRYDQARAAGTDVAGYAQALQRAGYATDPDYAAKIAAIANGDTLKRAVSKLNSNIRG